MVLRGLMSDAEWAFFALFLIENWTKSLRQPSDLRRVLDGVLYLARTGVLIRPIGPKGPFCCRRRACDQSDRLHVLPLASGIWRP